MSPSSDPQLSVSLPQGSPVVMARLTLDRYLRRVLRPSSRTTCLHGRPMRCHCAGCELWFVTREARTGRRVEL